MSLTVDLERGLDHSRSIAASEVSDDDGSCYSQFFSTTGGSYDEHSFAFVVASDESSSQRGSSVDQSECCSATELEERQKKGLCNFEEKEREKEKERERDCRICHLGLESNSHECGAPIELGCSCKDDLGSAHKNCAEAWFKIKGNKTCEICQSVACNVAGATEIELVEQTNEANNGSTVIAAVPTTESRSFWHGHRFLNFLLACMVFAFVVSWLFHFNVSS